ncbi:lysosomal acid phosphatase [Caerostris extrusa]|uniref:Lysosomal acid phosphatase n=1 Tax=Caerostris extrusa TaxID=172846 RepID=A0AAV4QQ60_CAEEX|nr:lysosomal acid phosphatase [Caerostris extrusa]
MWKYLISAALLYLFLEHVLAEDDSSTLPHQRELVYLQILITNGFYAPLSLYPNDENTEEDWPEGMGLLPKLESCNNTKWENIYGIVTVILLLPILERWTPSARSRTAPPSACCPSWPPCTPPRRSGSSCRASSGSPWCSATWRSTTFFSDTKILVKDS